MKTKKIIAIVAVLILSLNMCFTAFAETDIMDSQELLAGKTYDHIVAMFPDAVNIELIDNEFHVFIPHDYTDDSLISYNQKPTGLKSGTPTYSQVQTVYSMVGGSFRNYTMTLPQALTPYSQVFMPKSVAEAALIKMTESTIFEEILEKAALDWAYSQIANWISTNYNLNISESTVKAAVEIVGNLLINLEPISLESAINSSTAGKVHVLRATDNETGMPVTIYYSWTGTACTVYGGARADYYSQIYDIDY